MATTTGKKNSQPRAVGGEESVIHFQRVVVRLSQSRPFQPPTHRRRRPPTGFSLSDCLARTFSLSLSLFVNIRVLLLSSPSVIAQASLFFFYSCPALENLAHAVRPGDIFLSGLTFFLCSLFLFYSKKYKKKNLENDPSVLPDKSGRRVGELIKNPV